MSLLQGVSLLPGMLLMQQRVQLLQQRVQLLQGMLLLQQRVPLLLL